MLTQFKTPLKNGKTLKSIKNPKPKEQEIQTKWCITTDIPAEFPDFDPYEVFLASNPKKKTKAMMQLRAFLDAFYPCSTKDENKSSVMAISTHSPTMARIYGSPRGNLTGNSDALKMLQKIGLLEIVSEFVKFNTKDGDSKSRTYRFNHKVAEYLDEIIGDIEPYKVKIQVDNLNEYYSRYSPKIGYNSIPIRGNHIQIDEVVRQILKERYPIIEKTQEILRELNEFYADKPELLTKFEPNIRKTEHQVKKIGLRATNQMCNSKNRPELGGEISERKQLQKKYGLDYEYDINASISRVTMSINEGRWLSRDETGDIYGVIHEELKQEIQRRLDAVNYVIDNNLTNNETNRIAYLQTILSKFSKTIHSDGRDSIKYFSMRGYFSLSPQQMSSHIMNASDGTIPKAETDIMCSIFYDAMRNAIGETFGSAVFAFESAIMNLTALKLCKSGNLCGLVYDCFYTQNDVSFENFENLIAESFDELRPYFAISKTDARCFATASTSSSTCVPLSVMAASPLNSLESFNIDSEILDFDGHCGNCGSINSVENGICEECGFLHSKKFKNISQHHAQHNNIPLYTKIEFFGNPDLFLTKFWLKYPKLE